MTQVRDESSMIRRFYRARTLDGLGVAMRGARAARDLTQDDVAREIGSSRPTLSRIERGRPASTDTVLDALGACGYEVVVVPRGSVVTVSG